MIIKKGSGIQIRDTTLGKLGNIREKALNNWEKNGRQAFLK